MILTKQARDHYRDTRCPLNMCFHLSDQACAHVSLSLLVLCYYIRVVKTLVSCNGRDIQDKYTTGREEPASLAQLVAWFFP